MSFFDDMKNFGLVALVVGLINIIVGIVAAAYAGGAWEGYVVAAGTIIFGLLVALYALKVHSGEIGEKINILGKFVGVIGLANIVMGVCSAIVGDYTGGAIDIIVGLIMLFCSYKMMDNQVTTLDKIIWILLLIVFVLGIIGGLLGIFVIFVGTIEAIMLGVGALFSMLLYIFLILMLLSPDVKSKMGM